MGGLQERITSTKTGSITSIQAVYVPADDLTDPSPATTFGHLDATVVLSRDIASLGIYPPVDPLDSTSRQLDPNVDRRGALHGRRARVQADAAALQGAARHHRDSRHGRAVAGGQAGRRARAQDPALPVAAVPRRGSRSPARRASIVPLKDTIRGFKAIVDGEYDHLPEQAFYMIGAIEEADREGEDAAIAHWPNTIHDAIRRQRRRVDLLGRGGIRRAARCAWASSASIPSTRR